MLENNYYSRQTNLKEVGLEGQEKLKQIKVLMVGAGGLGHPAGTYLAAAGVGKITIIDFDTIEDSNLNRQVCFSPSDVGSRKSKILADRLRLQNPFIEVESSYLKLTVHNCEKIMSPFDIILDCTDNFAAKFLLHDASWMLRKKLVQASLYQFEGQIQVFNYAENANRDKGCLRCLWPSVPDKDSTKNCSDAGIIGAVAGVLGSMQAMEAIKLVLGIGSIAVNKTKAIDLLTLDVQQMNWKIDENCPLCSKQASITSLVDENYLKKMIFEVNNIDESDFIVIDIREEDEIIEKTNYLKRPLSELKNWKKELNQKDKYLFLCSKGKRSFSLVKSLRGESFLNCYSLFEGLDNFRENT